MLMFTLVISCLTIFTLIHGPNIPGSYAILLFTALDFTSMISYIHNCVHFCFCHFHHSVLECKSRKSRDTWCNSQIFGLGVQNGSRTKASRVLPMKCTSKHPLQKTQEKTLHMDITRWSKLKLDWLYFSAAKDGETLYSQQKQDQELTVAQIMNSLSPNWDLNWRK